MGFCMPVRKIPKNYLFVTGGYSSRKNEEMDAFESLLEKDYLLLLDFDDGVEAFEVQPVRIPVAGVPKGYVPDVLVKYRPDVETGAVRKPNLVRSKLLKTWNVMQKNIRPSSLPHANTPRKGIGNS